MMSLNSNNQLKFQEGSTTEPLTILGARLEELEYGSKFVVRIKPTIEGYDHFIPSPGLENKIKEENVDAGDKITIEKVAKSEKYQYGYFIVNVVEKNAAKPMHKSDEKFEKQFEPKEGQMELHELKARVHSLEEEVAKLKKNVVPF